MTKLTLSRNQSTALILIMLLVVSWGAMELFARADALPTPHPAVKAAHKAIAPGLAGGAVASILEGH